MPKFRDFAEGALFLLLGICLFVMLTGLTTLLWLIVIRAIQRG